MADEVLVERDVELGTLRAAFEAAAAGHGRLVLLEGPAGAGVSSLLRAALAEARARSLEVAEGRAAPGADRTASDFARALGAPDQTPDDGDALLARARRLHTPLVLAIDDAQWADPSTLEALLALRPWLAELPLVVVVGLHPGGRQEPPLLAHLRDAADADRVQPAALTADGLAAMAETRLSEPVASAFAAAAHALTAGSPWLAAVVFDALRERDLAPAPPSLRRLVDHVPAALRGRVERLLAERSPAAVALAEALAVLAEAVGLGRAAAVAALDEQTAAAAADELAEAGLVGAGEPLALAQPLVGAAVTAGMPAFRRVATHRRALGLLRGDGAPAARLARHLLAVPGAADPAAVTTLREAAAVTADPDQAVTLLRRALAEPPAPDAECDVLRELALAEGAAGAPEAVGRLRAALARREDPELQVGLARALLGAGDYPRAGALAEAALQALRPTDPAAQQLLLVELIACSVESRLHEQAMVRLARFAAAATAGSIPSDPGLCAWLAASMSSTGASAQTTRALVDRALAHSPLVDDSHPTIFSFARAALLNIDDVERADAAATAAMARARDRGLSVAHQLALHGRAVARLRAGRIDDALADARASQPRSDARWQLHARYGAAVLVSGYAERGEGEAARDALAAARAAPPNGALEEANVLHACGRLQLLEGDATAALATLLASGEALRAFGAQPLSPSCLPWASSAAHAAVALGDRVQARELAADELARARPTGLPGTIGIALRAAAAAERGAPRIALLTEAVRELGRSALRLEHAYALHDLGAAIREDGDRVAARGPLAEALDLADRCGATVLAGRARDQLRLAGARPRRAAITGVAALTARERRVAELAAGGDTNSEIAASLFLSTKTVEGTLARAYRKLGVRSRTELPAALEAEGG